MPIGSLKGDARNAHSVDVSYGPKDLSNECDCVESRVVDCGAGGWWQEQHEMFTPQSGKDTMARTRLTCFYIRRSAGSGQEGSLAAAAGRDRGPDGLLADTGPEGTHAHPLPVSLPSRPPLPPPSAGPVISELYFSRLFSLSLLTGQTV